MQNSEFEKNVQQKMGELKLSPTDTVWQKIETGLPGEKKPRRWVVFILLFGVLTTSSLVLWNHFNTTGERNTRNMPNAKETILQNTKTQNLEKDKQSVTGSKISVKKEESIKTTGDNTNNKKILTSASSLKIKIKSGTTGYSDNIDNTDPITDNQGILKTKATVKIKVNAPVTVSDVDERFIADPIEKDETGRIKIIIIADTAISAIDNLIAEIKKDKIDSASVTKKDTTGITATNKREKKRGNPNWQYGIVLASGISTVKNNLFSSTPVFADAFGNYISGSPNPQIGSIPNNPSIGAAFNFGFYVQRDINARWEFNTGLNYLYQSNTLKVGTRVDSVSNFNFDIYKSISADHYYRVGNSTGYKNKFHLLEIPFLFQYRLSKKSPLYFEEGATVAYLLNSNALVYNSNPAAYFTDATIFNKFLLSFNIGAGINLAQKTKLPFSIGYQFKYSIGSVIKKPYGKQHFVNSFFYLKIPLKK